MATKKCGCKRCEQAQWNSWQKPFDDEALLESVRAALES